MVNSSISTDLMLMIHRYVREAIDFTETPDTVWQEIKKRIMTGDLDALLIIYQPEQKLKGFMYCHLDPDDRNIAVIHAAYISPEIRDVGAIRDALIIYENWAKFHNARKGKFYTFRIPGAHRLMLKRGWKHIVTSYGKEL